MKHKKANLPCTGHLQKNQIRNSALHHPLVCWSLQQQQRRQLEGKCYSSCASKKNQINLWYCVWVLPVIDMNDIHSVCVLCGRLKNKWKYIFLLPFPAFVRLSNEHLSCKCNLQMVVSLWNDPFNRSVTCPILSSLLQECRQGGDAEEPNRTQVEARVSQWLKVFYECCLYWNTNPVRQIKARDI